VDELQIWERGVVTGHERSPATLGGVPVYQRLADAAAALAPAVLHRIVEELPAYAQLPPEELRGDITRIIERTIRAFIHMLRTGEPPPPALLDALREDVAQRAEEGLPPEAVVSAHHLGMRVAWDHFATDAAEGDLAAVVDLGRIQLRYLEDVTAAVCAAYVRERELAFGEQRAARHRLLDALLNGEPAADPAARAGVLLPPCYAVLGLAVGPHPDEHRDTVDRAVAARRKLRRLRAELQRSARGQVLSRLTPSGGLVLLPGGSADWAEVTRVIAAAGHAAGAAVTAGAAFAAPAGVGAAAEVAARISEVARAAAHPPGVYRLEDIALEYQLSRPGPARDILATLLDPLLDTPELMLTLRTHLREGSQRQHTAKCLHIHPNTVDYRLHKISELTGLNPGDPADTPRVRAALIARDAAHHDQDGHDRNSHDR
jgi:hypothetical protein